RPEYPGALRKEEGCLTGLERYFAMWGEAASPARLQASTLVRSPGTSGGSGDRPRRAEDSDHSQIARHLLLEAARLRRLLKRRELEISVLTHALAAIPRAPQMQRSQVQVAVQKGLSVRRACELL